MQIVILFGNVHHRTGSREKAYTIPVDFKGKNIQAKHQVKILDVIMDVKLKYRQHIARVASKGLDAAMELKRRGLSKPAVHSDCGPSGGLCSASTGMTFAYPHNPISTAPQGQTPHRQYYRILLATLDFEPARESLGSKIPPMPATPLGCLRYPRSPFQVG